MPFERSRLATQTRREPRPPKLRRAHAARPRGAVLAEFVIAIVPLLTASFSFLQLTKLQTAKLLLGHAAVCGARTAAVSSNVHGNNPGAGGKQLPERAVLRALDPWIRARSFTDVRVDVLDRSSREDPSGPVQVTVSAEVACTMPMMGRVLCRGPHKAMTASAVMPLQGASYEDEPAEEGAR